MKKYDVLKKNLNNLKENFETLLHILQKEKFSLLNLEMEGICEIVKEKDTALLKIKLIEEERQRLLKTLGLEGSKIINLYEETKDIYFNEIHSSLLSLMQSIDELNCFNRILIDRSIDFLKIKMKFLECRGIEKGKNIVSLEF